VTGAGPATGSQAVAQLRHHLRTPVNHIIGYAEMLLEDVPPGDDARREPLVEILAAAKDVLPRISVVLAPTRSDVPAESLLGLYADLSEPQARIVRAVHALQREAGAALDGAATEDLQRILRAAEQLTPSGGDGAAPPLVTVGDGAASAAHLLVVDDIAENREILQRRLARLGHRVQCAEDGRRALEMMAAEPFDLVLLDVMMPEMDGFEVLARIKQDPATLDIPVVVISALDDLASAARCIECGAEDYLTKPFNPVFLEARVGACLDKKRLRDRERAYLRDVDRVLSAADAVESGTYRSGTLAEVGQRPDPLGQLARVFDSMATQVRAREQLLHEQARALRAEIATARRATGGRAGASEHPALRVGDRLVGRYDILAVLGDGGMGAVYRARDLELDEDVALKILRRELVDGPVLIERFKTEIRLARRISHRNVVRTHDLGEWQGTHFLTMEYVEGITVLELLATRGCLGVDAVLSIGCQLADALAAAHGEGVIHRDIKPQNLLLDEQGVLKVMDFGVACLAEHGAESPDAGLVLGTPEYMPPEQLFGEEIDARVDLWACGVVMYECLTGRLPFDAPSPMALVAKLLVHEPMPLAELNPDVPPDLAAVVMQLLAKRREDRVPSAQALRERLGAVS
jgi:CheY-like chemotaxis protein